MASTHQRHGEVAQLCRAPSIHRIEILQPLADQPHTQIEIRGHRRSGAFGDVERVADMVAMTMSEQDMADAFDRRRLVGDESRIAGKERIDQYRLTLEVEAKGGMSVPGDLHDRFLWRHPCGGRRENSGNIARSAKVGTGF